MEVEGGWDGVVGIGCSRCSIYEKENSRRGHLPPKGKREDDQLTETGRGRGEVEEKQLHSVSRVCAFGPVIVLLTYDGDVNGSRTS